MCTNTMVSFKINLFTQKGIRCAIIFSINNAIDLHKSKISVPLRLEKYRNMSKYFSMKTHKHSVMKDLVT